MRCPSLPQPRLLIYSSFQFLVLVFFLGCTPFHDIPLLPEDLAKQGKIAPEEVVSWSLIREKVLVRCLDCHNHRTSPDLVRAVQVRENLPKILLAVKRGSMPPVRQSSVPLNLCQKAILSKWAELSAPDSSEVRVADLIECNVQPPEVPELRDMPLNFETLKSRILDPRCVHCHSPTSSSKANSLPFDSYEAIANDPRGRWSAPGASSRIFRSMTRSDKFRMPPPEYSDSLSKEEIDFIVRWIDAGKPAQ